MRPHLPLSLVLCACLPESGADLEGPRVVAASVAGKRSVEVSVRPSVGLELSETLNPETVHGGTVALVPWEPEGSCALTPVCAQGQCARGTCWEDPWGSSALASLDAGEWEPTVPLALELEGERLRIASAVTLEPHTLYSLVIGEGVRDPSGASLVDEYGCVTRWRHEIVTDGEGSAGPEARLVSPAAEQGGVPTNVERIRTRFVQPVGEGSLELIGEDGAVVTLSDGRPCPGWVPGFCVDWTVGSSLLPDQRYAIGGGTLVDLAGRRAVPPAAKDWFRTGREADGQVPEPGKASLAVRGSCVELAFVVGEPVEARLEAGAHAVEAQVEGSGTLALRVGPEHSSVRLRLRDLAGNESETAFELEPVPPDVGLRITELLANPDGTEPHQEFVELYTEKDVSLDGLWLSDLSWEEVAMALAAGDAPGDALSGLVAAGELVLIVAQGFDEAAPEDVPPAVGTRLVRVDASLGEGGLKNAGEPLTLYRADPPTLIASYGNFIDTSATAHGGRSVSITRPDACDVAASWRSHPLGRATPGRLP